MCAPSSSPGSRLSSPWSTSSSSTRKSSAMRAWTRARCSSRIAAAVSTLVMALYANYPIALAPGMGLNAFFAFTVVLTMREGCSLFQSNTVKYVYVARKARRTACDQRTAQIIAAGNPEIASTDQAKRLYEYGCVTEMDIVQLIYRPTEPQGALKDFQFGRSTMEARWQQELSDARTTLHASPWLAPMPKELGVRVYPRNPRRTS